MESRQQMTTNPVFDAPSLEEQVAYLTQALTLAETKLLGVKALAEVIDQPVSAVWVGQVAAKSIRDIISVQSIEEFKALSKGGL